MANFGVICSVADEMRELGKLINGAPLKTQFTRAERGFAVNCLLLTNEYIYDNHHSSRLKLDSDRRTSIMQILRSIRATINKALDSKGLEMIGLNYRVMHHRDIPDDPEDSFRVSRWHVDFKSDFDKVFVAGGEVANLQIFDDPNIPTETSEERLDENVSNAVERAIKEFRGRLIDVAQGDVMLFDPNTIHRRGPLLHPRRTKNIRGTISSGVWPITRDQG